jgi:hypothetical protein
VLPGNTKDCAAQGAESVNQPSGAVQFDYLVKVTVYTLPVLVVIRPVS